MDMDVIAGTGNEIETQIGPQLIRITNHLKMSACVAFALKFLDVCTVYFLILRRIDVNNRLGS